MFTRSVIVAVVLYAPAYAVELNDQDRRIVERGAECGVDPWLGLDFLHVETLAGLTEHRGMLIAQACRESRGNPKARGDWRIVDGRRVAKAVGILQLWGGSEKVITTREDPIASAYVFLGALFDGLRRARRYCPKVKRRLFRLAWIRVNRGPFWRREDRAGEPRCHGTHPAGLKLLRRWKR